MLIPCFREHVYPPCSGEATATMFPGSNALTRTVRMHAESLASADRPSGFSGIEAYRPLRHDLLERPELGSAQNYLSIRATRIVHADSH